jgi:hypothetical protein
MRQSTRVQKEFVFELAAPPEQVFPLLCPVRESDWLDGWEADMVYSASGVAEDHAVFTTDFPDRGRGTWVVSHYDPQRFEIGFTIFYADACAERLDVSLTPSGPASTRTRWMRTYTALSEAGRRYLERNTGEALDARMAGMRGALQKYCETGGATRGAGRLLGLS